MISSSFQSVSILYDLLRVCREQFLCVIQRDLYFSLLSAAVSESKETSLILSHCSQYSSQIGITRSTILRTKLSSC